MSVPDDSDPRAVPGTWRTRRTEDGTLTLVHPVHGEACHSDVGAWRESWERYVEGCRLPERLRAEQPERLRVLDVGTGLGWNLAAVLVARDRFSAATRLDLVTLESDPEVMRTAIGLGDRAGQGPQAEALLEIHRVLSECLGALAGEGHAHRAPTRFGYEDQLTLCLGDARDTLPELAREPGFDAVFLDPFSPRREPDLWAAEFLEEIAVRCAPDAWLSTYSASTGVRVALSLAGFEIGPGARVGAKAEGTLARRGAPLPPFEPKIARRIARRVGEFARESGRSSLRRKS